MARTYLAFVFMLLWTVACGVIGAILFGWLFGRET
jgi:hypothetical protein